MIKIEIKDKSKLDKALKIFKKKFEKIGIIKELRKRKEFEKPSVTRRQELKKAKYVNKKFGNS